MINNNDTFESIYTTNLPELLKTYNGSIMATTYQTGKLITIRADGNNLNTHFHTFNHPMGLAIDKNKLSIGTNLEIIDFYNIPELTKSKYINPKHDAVYAIRNSHMTGYIDIHEMAYDQQGTLWFVNTLFSCLCTVDMVNSFTPRWKPFFISQYRPEDRCHLNGLAMRDGIPRYVTALGETNSFEGWRVNKKDGGIIIDMSTQDIIARNLSMPHSPRWWNNNLYVLESGTGSLCLIDLKSGNKTVIAKVPGFCRGLDFIGNLAFIGLSQLRESTPINNIPITEDNQERLSGIWIVNILTGQTEAFLKFTGQIQEIFALQFINNITFPEIVKDGDILKTCYVIPSNIINNT